MAKLFIVGTPIGNLDDITLRAVNTLKEVNYIACEDTRHTQKLLQHFGIKKPLLACHAHNERASAEGIIKLLAEGNTVAYCSDAGTPGISDPGSRLVDSVLKAGYGIEPIPGVSAFTTLISVAGYQDQNFLFEGFLPQKGLKRTRRLQELLELKVAFVLYESPYRIENLMASLAEMAGERSVVIGREMTKMHEEFLRGTAIQLKEQLKQKKILGEFALLVSSC